MYQPTAEVFSNTNRLTNRLVAQGLVALGVFVGLIWITTRNIIQPLQVLTTTCQIIAAGDLSQPVPIIGTAETLTLGHSFEEMRKALLDYRGRMETVQHELEERVTERTIELVHIHDFLLKTNNNLTALNSMAAILINSLDLEEIINNAVDRVLEIMSAEVGGIYLLDEQESALILAAQHGVPGEILPSIQRLDGGDLIRSSLNKQPVSTEPAIHSACRNLLAKKLGLPTFAYLVLHARGKSPGGLFVASQKKEDFNSEDLKLLEAVSWLVAMAVLNAQLYKDVLSKEQERTVMLRLAIDAQEEERKRVARELHDETSQSVTTLLLGLETLEKALATNPGEVATIQTSLKGIARQMLENIKRIMTDLRPSLLDDMGLISAVSWYGDQRLKHQGIKLLFEHEGFHDGRLPPELEIALFRIIQEALTNVVRHAHASQVSVHLERREQSVFLHIADNGWGFNPKENRHADFMKRELGLRGMRERSDILGGKFDLRTTPGQGTIITVELPLLTPEDLHA